MWVEGDSLSDLISFGISCPCLLRWSDSCSDFFGVGPRWWVQFCLRFLDCLYGGNGVGARVWDVGGRGDGVACCGLVWQVVV